MDPNCRNCITDGPSWDPMEICLECKVGAYFNTQDGTCTYLCPDGLWGSDITKNCEPCHSSCGTCSGGDTDANCVSCPSTPRQLYKNSDTGQCVALCPEGTW